MEKLHEPLRITAPRDCRALGTDGQAPRSQACCNAWWESRPQENWRTLLQPYPKALIAQDSDCGLPKQTGINAQMPPSVLVHNSGRIIASSTLWAFLCFAQQHTFHTACKANDQWDTVQPHLDWHLRSSFSFACFQNSLFPIWPIKKKKKKPRETQTHGMTNTEMV